jgi:uncharacterized Zn-finger protein
MGNSWFLRTVLISWFIGAVLVLVVFKNMELIVHGQLYYYGLVFSPEWADPYRVFTWLIYVCLGMQMALSGLALISSFLKVEKLPKRTNVVQQVSKQPQVVKAESRPIVREMSKTVENNTVNGITCPHCKKVFSRALVMLDFHGGKNKLVSVCPYCNEVLAIASEEKSTNSNVHVSTSNGKIIR